MLDRTDSPAFYEERIRLLEAENQRLRGALTEPMEPCGNFASKLEWLAFWLDGMDSVLESATGEPMGHDVQDDLRRWAKDWRAALGGTP